MYDVDIQEALEEMLNAGFITSKELVELMNYPGDVEANYNMFRRMADPEAAYVTVGFKS